MHLYLAPDGDVRACCRNWEALGNIATQRLPDIWDGAMRKDLMRRLEVDDFSLGCDQCDAEVLIEGRQDSYRANFDRFGPVRDHPWPLRIEFNISNACNLQCVQCNGFLSSAIRTHRDKLPPLQKVYGEEFFEDLRTFIPHLTEAQFAGGEPFLAPENFRVWDLIEELSPGLPCTVVTNATQWSSRIERVVATHRMGFAFSIDGATKETYESIRIGADFDQVMVNLDRYTEHARRSGMFASINHCLMAQNFRELPLMLGMAEERGMAVDISVVRSPGHSSVARLPRAQIQDGLDSLLRHDAEMSALTLNGATWRRELNRLEQWASAPDESRQVVWWDDVERTLAPQQLAITRREARILDFPCKGSGPTDDAAARAELAQHGQVLTLTVAGKDSLVVDHDPALPEAIGAGSTLLVGEPAMDLMALLPRRFGHLSSLEEVSRTDDLAVVRVELEHAEIRCMMVPLRDGSGWASKARMLVSIAER